MEAHAAFNTFDYIVMGLVLLSGLLALMRGLVREVFSLIAWVGAYFAAVKYYPIAEPWTQRYIKSASMATDAAAIIVFIGTFIILSLLGFIIARLIRGEALTAIDRSLGFVFGILRGTLVICLIYLVAISVLWPDINKPPEPTAIQPIDKQPQVQVQKQEDKDKNPAPEWLVHARTRPFLTLGALELKTLIPESFFEKKTQQYLDQKKAATKAIEQNTDNLLPSALQGNQPQTAAPQPQAAPAQQVAPAPAPVPTYAPVQRQ